MATLRCGKLSTGKVTWSRDIDGKNESILTTHNGHITRHMSDRDRRYGSGADIVLIILRVSQSDAGRYYCNGATVELTVLTTNCPKPPNSINAVADSQIISTQSSSILTTTEGSTSKDKDGETGVETGLMFGGVGLAALVFLLATVAAGSVVLLRVWQAG
ncbi:hypothetical protein AMEX_G4120 [Astyanax mexicanus]|uniref:Ig-like domain-containing protein n=1 Tax=Astyanax mexicanus TaxID=7994 RepID=A0A8T2MHN8_ASTMX|nr:hypothetical protein AMEX_G4120 [Astyanax mexicanus]